MGYVIYEKWFNRKDFRNTLKDFPTIFGTIIWKALPVRLVQDSI
jgi:hypothetical protein